jgi:HEAT repeat protein
MQQFANPRFGPHRSQGKDAIPALTKSLKSDVYYIRAGAAEALGRMGPEAKVAVPALLSAAKDENALVRKHAAEALGRLDPSDGGK